MSLLIIPDIHGRSFWKSAVKNYFDEVSKVVFLGDYLDAYQEENITRKQEKENFKEIIDFKKKYPDKIVLLLGNHCMHYIDKRFLRSTRFSSSNAYEYRELFLSNKSLFKIAHEEIINEKKYLFTHAGIMKSWYDRNKKNIGELTVGNLNGLLRTNIGISILSEVSKYRSWIGEESGSPLWSDMREKIDLDKSTELKIIPNIDSCINEYDYQIFGHTMLKNEPIITDRWACIDVKKAFILSNNGELIEYKEEKENEKIKTDKEHGTIQDTEDDKP